LMQQEQTRLQEQLQVLEQATQGKQ
jgi:hypothetical protein